MTLKTCSAYSVCGGCSEQHISYEEQLKNKETLVQSILKELPCETWFPIAPSPEIYFYRNKMEYSFGDSKDVHILSGQSIKTFPPETDIAVHLGLHPRKRFNLVVPTRDCLLLSPDAQKILALVSTWATINKIPSYVRSKNAGVLRHLTIREGKNTGERLVNLVATSQLPATDELARELISSGIPITTFIITAHDGLSDVAKGKTVKVLWGTGTIHETIGEVNFRIPMFSFMQTNTHAAEKMLATLKNWVQQSRDGDKRGKTLFDLYCGVGVIGLTLSSLFDKVVGIEADELATEEAFHNARMNNISNAEFLPGKTENLVAVMSEFSEPDSATIVVDPPRGGLHNDVIEALLKMNTKNIFYISCNPTTLSRDLLSLSKRYSICKIMPFDLFPHTAHVEVMVHLSLPS